MVGGSLAGLSAANWLRASGWDVVVLERSATPLADQGAGIVLHPSTTRLLTERAGIPWTSIGVGVSHLRYLDRSGQVVADRGCRYRFSAYGALYRALRDLFQESGGTFLPGVTVAGARSSEEGAAVVDAAGSEMAAALVVGADGVRSTVRRFVDPTAGAVTAGYVAWRGVADEATLPVEVLQPMVDAITYTILERSHVLTYPIAMGDGSLVRNWVWYRNLRRPDELADILVDRHGVQRDLSVPAGAVRDELVADLVREGTRVLPPQLAALVASTAAPFIQVVTDVFPATLARGRVCLVGDAGFVARPHAAAGTAKAAEEARLLSQALGRPGTDVQRALSRWAGVAEPAARELVARSRLAGERAQVQGTWRIGEPLPFGLRRAGDSEC